MADKAPEEGNSAHTSSPSGKPAFVATRLTATTFTLNEHSDKYDEQPLIYVKILSKDGVILIIDTGCGGATDDPDIDVKSLRVFLETVNVPDNGNKPLNEGAKMRYIVILTHCHYDHILAVEQFAEDSPILASGHNPSFLDPSNLPAHSLCDFLHIATPKYTPVLVPHMHNVRTNYPVDAPNLAHDAPSSLSLVVLHTPGHTPDELAVWDSEERVLYVGDTLYEYAHIIFPNEGSIVDWMHSTAALLELVGEDNAKICCGHVTAGRPAREVLLSTRAFMKDVISGKEPVRKRFEKRGETAVEYVQEGMRYSLICPERLVLEARDCPERKGWEDQP